MASPPWSEPFLRAVAIVPKVGGSLSIVGSAFVLRDIGRKWQDVPLPVEVMAHIAISLLMIAFWECFLSTWMVPRGSHAYAAVGTGLTCGAQGFISIAMFTLLEISYAILAVLYWGVVAKGWKERKTRRRTFRFLFLGLPTMIAIGLASAMAALGMFNFNGFNHCSLADYPLDCSWTDEPCERGEGADAWSEFFFICIFACTAMILVFMTLLVVAVRKQEKRQDRYMTRGEKKNRNMTRRAFWQAVRYISVFCVANLPFYLFKAFDLLHGMAPNWVVLVYVAIWPMFGVMNALAYFRPKYLSYRDMNRDKSFWQSLLFTLQISLPEPLLSRYDSDVGNASRGLLEGISHDGDDIKDDLISPLIQEEENYGAGGDMGSLLFGEEGKDSGRGSFL